MMVIYNVLMFTAICMLFPLWMPIVALREKHRRAFSKRLFMPALTDDEKTGGVNGNGQRIWIHALSVGEVLSAEPLVRALAQAHGRSRLFFTASTHTGFEIAARVIAPHVGAMRYFPYDTPFSVNRAFKVVNPRKVVIVETDIWPNFLFRVKQRRIPVYLINARLSDRSFNGYKRIRFFTAPLLTGFNRICVQTDLDRQRFREIGIAGERLVTVGNIKFDQTPAEVSPGKKEQLDKLFRQSAERPIWVAGSTHEKEEEILTDAYLKICASGIDPVLIIAPRNPGRAGEVRNGLTRRGVHAITMGQLEKQQSERAGVVVIDRIGVLRSLYTLADVAFVGGSLVNAGGHNPLEPASVAKPILFGPHTNDFRWICQTLENAGGAIRVFNAQQLSGRVAELIQDKEKRDHIGQCAYGVFAGNQGAVARTVAAIENAF